MSPRGIYRTAPLFHHDPPLHIGNKPENYGLTILEDNLYFYFF